MTKMEAYRYCEAHGAEWIANVILACHTNKARKLKALAKALGAGRKVDVEAFEMPSEGVLINGKFTKWDELI